MRSTSLIALIVLLLTAVTPAASAQAGTLTLDRAEYPVGTAVKATYTTDRPTNLNWIGLYTDPGNAPVNGVYVGPSTAWVYAPGASGTVSLPTDGLTPGAYIAYFLHNDGYAALSAPVRFRVVGLGHQPPRFLADPTPLRNARVGAPYSARVPAVDPDGSTVRYRKIAGPTWVSVSTDGTVAGTPRRAGVERVTVEATDGEGLTARATATITVRAAGERLVPEPVVTAFNAWHSGSRVRDGVTKQMAFLLSSGSDVVGVSESRGTHARTLAEALGWYWAHDGNDLGIVSKYPLGETFRADAGFGARVRFAPGEEAVLWDVHLNYTPYGPYDACFDRMSVAQLVQREHESGRVREIEGILSAMRPHLADRDRTPVFLVGDFNAPSHLDWTPAAASTHCGYTVAWPVSRAVQQAGLTDTYRAVHPDPVTAPGTTWSPVYPRHNGSTGAPEPQDRIDFVHSAGRVQATSSEAVVLGTPTAVPNHQDNLWSSDHAAVITRFRF
ncbi:putative Ig domain-containing protein [Actinosynnema sp. CA-248983]